ncbi:hypothetical protein PISMIDRAFT_681802 [Pisolithus microcarpus 441]|uniref:Uncharacterized protein n=1 Tax=Pisolithus microcarpus 441 TaxID=765257 RepID=A0A0C9Y8J8_9AGAM|nr:hypothetical protein PISMIDRAFT_681802 [Pisolithus microcarpus 441]
MCKGALDVLSLCLLLAVRFSPRGEVLYDRNTPTLVSDSPVPNGCINLPSDITC